MKNLLAIGAFLVLTFVVVGWYMNWYQVNRVATEGGRHQITVDINSPKISEDLQNGREQVAKILENVKKDQNKKEENPAPANFPTFTNPVPQSQPQQPQQAEIGFRRTEDGFFILPEDLFPPEPKPQTPPR